MNQVYIPRSVYAYAAIGTGLANLFFAMIPLALLMLVTGAPVSWALFFLPISILIISLFALGLGLIMSAFSVFFADALNIHRILLQLLMWMSGIFYSLESLPERVRTIIGLAPTYHMVTIFRAPLYSGELPPLISILYASGIAVAFFVVGLWTFMRMSDAIAYRV
jgi:ABC-type polysaccharide/polyol phosphate export permease